MMTPGEAIARLRELEKAATPGPWRSEARCVFFARKGPSCVGDYEAPYGVGVSGEMVPAAGYLPVSTENCDATADLIAESRNALPALLDVADAAAEMIDAMLHCEDCEGLDHAHALRAALNALPKRYLRR